MIRSLCLPAQTVKKCFGAIFSTQQSLVQKKQVILVGSKEALHIAMVTPPEPRKSMLVIKTHRKMHFAA